MVHTIYAIENKLSGRAYVGRTVYSMMTRWKAHLQADSELGRDMRTLGKDNFTLRELATATHSYEASHLERLFTHLLESNDPLFGYNHPEIYRWPRNS